MQLCIGYGIWCALMNETIAGDLNDGEGSPSETGTEKTSIGFFRFGRQTMSESVNVTKPDLLFFNWNDSDVEVWVIPLENKKLNEIQ